MVEDGSFVINAEDGLLSFGENGVHVITNWRLRSAIVDAGLSLLLGDC